jgi:hypothetical protein
MDFVVRLIIMIIYIKLTSMSNAEQIFPQHVVDWQETLLHYCKRMRSSPVQSICHPSVASLHVSTLIPGWPQPPCLVGPSMRPAEHFLSRHSLCLIFSPSNPVEYYHDCTNSSFCLNLLFKVDPYAN